MISLLSKKLAKSEHGIVYPSNAVHISTLPLKLAKINKAKKTEKHDGFSVGDCIKKNQGKVDDPGAYCASIQDKISGTTQWRGDKGKEADSVTTNVAQLRGKKKESAKSQAMTMREANNTPFKNHVFQVILLKEGMGNFKDCFFYTKDALKQAASNRLFEGKQAFADHPTEISEQIQPERSTRDILGYYENIRYQESADGSGELIANLCVANSISLDWAMSLLTNSLDYTQKFSEGDLVGLSINASGSADPADIDQFLATGNFSQSIVAKLMEAKNQGITQINVVSQLTDAQSVDLVTKAGAGGRILSMLEQEKSMKKKEEKHKQTEDGAGSMPPASHAQQPGAGATPDHADADQDKALFAKMIKQYLGKDGADEEEMEMAKHAYQAHKEGGMSHEEAYEAAGKHLKMAMAIGKKMAQGKQSESEGECEDEKAHESEGDMEAEEAQSPPPNPKGDAKKESFQVAKLAGEVAKLRESVRSYEVREYLDDKMKKSGEPVSVTKKFREALGTPKSKEQIDATWKIFLSAFKAASEEVGDGMLFMEKSYRESGEKEGSSFLDCLR